MSRPCMWLLLSMVSSAATICHGEPPAEIDRVAISGRVVDAESRGVAGVKVRGVAYTDITEAITDDNGQFVLNVNEQRVRQLAIIADDVQGDRLGTYKAKSDDHPDAKTSIKILLVACQRLPVEVTDAKGEPAPGVRVGALINYAPLVSAVTNAAGKAVLKLPTDAEIQSLYATKPAVGFDYRVVQSPRDKAHRAEWLNKPPIRFQLADSQTVQIRLVDSDDKPIAGMELYLWLLNKPDEPDSFNLGYTPTDFHATTDEAGIAEFLGVPDWDIHPLIFWPLTDEYVHDRITFDPNEHSIGQLTVKLDRLVGVTGRVRFADGRPAADISISATGTGYKLDRFRKVVTTDREGNFNLRVAPNLLYMFAALDEQWAATAIDGLIVRPDEPVDGIEFELRPSTRVHGQVTVGPENKPVDGQRLSLRQEGRNLRNLEGDGLPNLENSRRSIQPSLYRGTVTDENGKYEFFVGPGKFTLSGPSQVKPKKFEVVNESELAFNFASPRPEKGPFTGTVVTGDPPQVASGAIIDGIYRATSVGRNLRLRTDERGRFVGERDLHPVVLRAESQDGNLAGILEVGPNETEVTILIGPLASATARLIDFETGDPLPDTEVQWGRRVHRGDDDAPWRTAWGGKITTDASGYFEITGLVVGQEYSLSVPRDDGRFANVSSVTPDEAKTIELGDLELQPPYKPPTFEERVDRELAVGRATGERYDRALKEAKRLRQHVLVVFLNRGAPLSESWFKLRLDDRPVQSALPDYQLIQVSVESEGAAALADRLGVMLDAEKLPVWRFSDALGKELETSPVPRLPKEGGVDRVALLERLARYTPEPLDARQLMKEALAEATTSNRRVIVQETATWCGPCHMLARYLERHRSIWEKDYLWVRIDQRWHGSDEVMNKIKEGYRGGIPWFAILDSNSQVLATSDGPDGNIGFPSEPASIDHFLTMFQLTMQRMSDKELAALRKGLDTK